MISRDVRRWRAFYTWPRAEKKCEARLTEGRIEVFLPKHTVVRQWKDRKKKVVEPLFPNYIFARVDERERLRVLQEPGIVRCVTFDGAPAELSDDEVDQLRRLPQEGARLTAVDLPRPGAGTRVTIVEGPLRGLSGEVVDHQGHAHLVLCIPAIRQALRIHVPAGWIRPADVHRHAA